MDEALRQQIRAARGKFAAMAVTYGLGVFNDSFFRQAAMLLVLAAGQKSRQGWIMAIFTLPYLLFASQAGWLADRFCKRHVVVGAKLLELAAMICGAVGIITGSWLLILAMVFTMGLQSCFFGPALNGSIPELYPTVYVTRANARLKVVVTVAILTGIACSGLALSRKSDGWTGVSAGRLLIAGVAVGVSALGVLVSFGVPRRPAADPNAPFPWSGPADTVRRLAAIARDSLLAKVVAADIFVWFVGSLLVPLINTLAIEQLGRDEAMASYMVAVEVVGVAIGGMIAGRLATGPRWYRVLPVGALGMSLALMLMAALPALPAGWAVPAAFSLLGLTGIAGGMYMIPCEAFVQIRPPAGKKGTVIASVNFAVFTGILLSGPVANVLLALPSPSAGIAAVGLMALGVGLWLWRALRREERA